MAKTETRKFYRRAFLNKPGFHTTAFILAEVVRSTYNGGKVTYYYTLKLSDCDRQIELDFGGTTKRARENDLHKIDKLVDTLTGFRDQMLAAHAELTEQATAVARDLDRAASAG